MPLTSSIVNFFDTNLSDLKIGTGVLVACSGGPDSVALACALKSLEKKLPFKFCLGHIHHHLRGHDSDADAGFVELLAKRFHWPFRLAHAPVRHAKGNLEENARVERYNALLNMAQQMKCQCVLTAHTLDDQCETILMNILRGTGPIGLSGIGIKRTLGNSQVILARPLLQIEKSELVQFLGRLRQPYRRDRSNRDVSFLRNWLRLKILPSLEKRSPGFKYRLNQTATLIRTEQDYWQGLLPQVERKVIKRIGRRRLLDLKRLLRYPEAVQRRLLRRVAGGDLLTFDGVERWRHWMVASPTSGRLWQLRKGWMVERLSRSKGSPSAHLFCIKQVK